MSEESLVTCPHCGELVDAGVVCEACGKALPAASEATGSGGQDSKERGNRQQAMAGIEISPGFAKPTAAHAEEDRTDSAANRAEKDTINTTYADVEDDDCSHFRLEFNTARIFIAGWGSSFNFRLFPLLTEATDCKDAHLEVVLREDKKLHKRIYGLRLNQYAEVDLNFLSDSCAIENAAEVYLSYRLKNRLYRYVGVFKWDCLSPEAPGKIIENLEIRMEGINAGPAAEQNIHLLKDVHGASRESVIKRLNRLKLEPVWKNTPLYDVVGESPPAPMAEVRHLTLIGPQKQRIHLMSGRELTIGRKPKMATVGTAPCDIAASVVDATGGVDLYATNFIHRNHASIVEASGTYQLIDSGTPPLTGGRYNPRRNGTFLNSQRINDGASVQLAPGQEHEIGLSLPTAKTRPYFRLHAKVLLDSKTKDPTALVLRRSDGLNEIFVHVARGIPLKYLIEEPTAVKIRRRLNAFQIEADGWENWLQPGQSVPGLPGWFCLPYKQATQD